LFHRHTLLSDNKRLNKTPKPQLYYKMDSTNNPLLTWTSIHQQTLPKPTTFTECDNRKDVFVKLHSCLHLIHPKQTYFKSNHPILSVPRLYHVSVPRICTTYLYHVSVPRICTTYLYHVSVLSHHLNHAAVKCTATFFQKILVKHFLYMYITSSP